MGSSLTIDPKLSDLLPKDLLSVAALEVVTPFLPHAILNHSLRVYLYAKHLRDKATKTRNDKTTSMPTDRFLFVAALFHDIGASSYCDEDAQRFEVCGADAAREFLRVSSNFTGQMVDHISEEDADSVWRAIALHTSPHIAERESPLSRLMRLGPLIDFVHGRKLEFSMHEYAKEVEEFLPRLGIEKCLGDAVVSQAVKMPAKAPKGSWPGDLTRAYKEKQERQVEEWEGGINPEF